MSNVKLKVRNGDFLISSLQKFSHIEKKERARFQNNSALERKTMFQTLQNREWDKKKMTTYFILSNKKNI